MQQETFHWPHKDLLDVDQLTQEELFHLLDTAANLHEINSRPVKKVPILKGKSVVLFFAEPSTRTKTSFDMAGKRLSADTFGPVSYTHLDVYKRQLLLAAGTGVLAMLGTEGDKTDYAAHLFGLLSGFIVGGTASWISRRTALPSPVINTLLGLSAAVLVVLCWRLAY